MEDFLKEIDFKALKKQKAILINMIQDWGEADDKDQKKDAKEVEGILNLIDTIQEKAVDEFGYSEEEVFNLGKEN